MRTAVGVRFRFTAMLVFLALLWSRPSNATGITADAGMTPPLDRWIFRTQFRYTARENGKIASRMFMTPLVLAYGVRPDLTFILRQPLLRMKMSPIGKVTGPGVGDLALISKYRVLRINRQNFIFAVAPTFGFELPTGDVNFGSNTWDMNLGLFISGRREAYGFDFNFEHKLDGLGRERSTSNDETTANLAVGYQFTANKSATLSMWPVLETTYFHIANEESGVLMAPGMKVVWQSFVPEFLFQLPVHQNQQNNFLTRKPGWLFGIRYMF